MYPDDCIQSLLDDPRDWWVKDDDQKLSRGALVSTFIPHFDQTPYAFKLAGRTQATEHRKADIVVEQLRVNAPLKQVDLPVAAMPLYKGEVWAAYKAKGRPCLVISEIGPTVDKSLTRGMPRSSSAPTVLVAPFYGADKDRSRAGYNQEFVDRIKHCVYPQFVWDMLPLDRGPDASILRLDQIQPIGAHYNSHKSLGYRLCDKALEIIDDLITWLVRGGLLEDSDVLAYRDLMQEYFS